MITTAQRCPRAITLPTIWSPVLPDTTQAKLFVLETFRGFVVQAALADFKPAFSRVEATMWVPNATPFELR